MGATRATLTALLAVGMFGDAAVTAAASAGSLRRAADSPQRASGPSRRLETMRRHFTPRDQQTGRYQYVPFDVAAGTTHIRIAYRYDKADGGNVVDLGLFEPGPLELGTRAYRGWSGGERTQIEVGVDRATPGYWPGPLPAGRWHVMLGLYKVAEKGVDVEVDIETSSEPFGPAPALASRPVEPIRGGPAWYAGALHAHTHHSDGALPPAELARRARAEGLDFLAITDHNNTAHQLEPVDVPGLLLITGEEITTPGGHVNAWGLGGARVAVDFRVLPDALSPRDELAELLDPFRARGVVFSINHPRSACLACSWTHAVPDAVTALEIANVKHAEIAEALVMWDTLLRQGRRIVAVGTSDWHRGAAPIGSASVRVHARELSTPAVLDAIRAGRVVVMSDAATPPPEVTARAGNQVVTVGGTLELARGDRIEIEAAASAPAFSGSRVDLVWRGETLATATLVPGVPLRFERFAQASGYLRLHFTATNGQPLALANPIWVSVRP